MAAACECVNIFKKYMQFLVDDSPEFATYKGLENGTNDKLDSYSLSAYANRNKFYKEILEEIQGIERSSLSKQDLTSLYVFEYSIETALKGIKYKTNLVPWNFWEGVDQFFINYTLPRIKFNTEQDYVNYIARLKAFPTQIDETLDLLREGLKQGVVAHKLALGDGATAPVKRLQKFLDSLPVDLPFYKPFLKMPDSLSEKLKSALSETGKELMSTCIKPPLEKAKIFIEKEYMPHLRTRLSVDLVPGPTDRYKAYLQYFCDTDISPKEMHDIGLREVERLKSKLSEVMQSLHFNGTTKEFIKSIETCKELYFDNVDDIKPYCQHVIDNVITPKLEKLFFKPSNEVPMEINALNLKYPSRGVYSAPPLDGSEPAMLTLWVNSEFGRYEVIPLMLHETVPGHHLQACAMQGSTSLPSFRTLKDDRRYFETPGRTPLFSAYTEGWGLYCEDLGHELGLYDDPYDEYGYLVYNFTRAVRIVADTGIHTLGWSEEDVMEYVAENAPLAKQQIEQEIPRYVGWPGQGCSYTYGMLQIKAFRAKAESELGSLFDVRQFHQECLDCGPVPLPILEKIIDNYIQKTKDANGVHKT